MGILEQKSINKMKTKLIGSVWQEVKQLKTGQ